MIHFFTIVLVAALFLGILLNLATESQTRRQLTGISAVIAAVIGVLIYGYGFVYTFGPGLIAIFRALLAICRMFAGVNEFSTIQNAPILQNSIVIAFFWMGHFLAFYVTASTAVAALGGKLLYKIRSILLKRGDLLVIYGVGNESLAYARNIKKKKHVTILFVAESCDAALEAAVTAIGAIVDRSEGALKPDERFLHRIGIQPGKRKILFAALSNDSIRNLAWAKQLQTALEKAGIHPEQTSLLLQGVEEQKAGEFLGLGDNGFGAVYAFNEYSLAARLMVSSISPWDTISFDEAGRAKESFAAAIIGFGQMGRAALKQLTMNGQFDGSEFRVDVFDQNIQAGSFYGTQLVENHQIHFHEGGGRSEGFYQFLKDHGNELKYIVISTGDQQENQEIAQELEDWYGGRDSKPAIVQITKKGLLCSYGEKTDLTYKEIYDSDAMDLEKMDSLAMTINQQYCADNGKTAEENWKSCDYFSRMSCRASADFAGAVLKAAGKTEEELLAGEWKPDSELLEHLAITEHLRWCTFHEVMGYRTMEDSVWQERADAYLSEKEQNGRSSIRIGKDTRHKLHACLITWDALDELSRRENRVTGGHVDYKEMDRQNVLALPLLLGKM